MHLRITTPYARLEAHEIIPYLTNTLYWTILYSSSILTEISSFLMPCPRDPRNLSLPGIYIYIDRTNDPRAHERHATSISYYYQSDTASPPIFSLTEYAHMSNSVKIFTCNEGKYHSYFVPSNKTIRYECLRVPTSS